MCDISMDIYMYKYCDMDSILMPEKNIHLILDEYTENACLFVYSHLPGNLGKNTSCILIGICLTYI